MKLLDFSGVKFSTKSGRELKVIRPSLGRLDALLAFVNRLVAEDTFLNLSGRPKTLSEEERWLKYTLQELNTGRGLHYWAVLDDRIVASINISHGMERSWHVGKVGLMVDQEFRRDGIGEYLLKFILGKAKKSDFKLATLEVFSDNKPAIKLYRKLGFKIYGQLPNGLKRKNNFSDNILMYKEITTPDPSLKRRGE